MVKIKWIAFMILIASMILTACSGKPAGTANSATATEAVSTPSGPVTVRIGWAGSPDTLNPASALLSEAFVIFELAYSSMYELLPDGTYQWDLGESVDIAPDAKTYTYKIHSGVKFHDGTALTAKDVAFSYNFYKNHPDFPYMAGYTTSFESVEATDDSTVVIKLTDPIPNIESQLVFMFILPSHIWTAYDNDKAAEYENTELIGSGPFRLVEYKQGESVHLTRYDDYFGTGPKINDVVFQTFSNQDALVQALKTSQVDMITEMPNTAVAALKNDPNIKVVTGAPFAPDVTDILINQIAPENCPEGSSCTGHPALQDINVRQALAYATDKQELINIVLLGFGTKGLTLIPDSLGQWYNDTIPDYPFDIAKANQLLDAAGYKDTDGDGVRQMPDGSTPLIFRLNWGSDSTVAPRLAELVSNTWAKIGIKTQMQALDPDALSSICCPTFDYDLIIWGWGSDPDPSFLLSVMRTDEIPTGMSETGYSNPEYDTLFDEQSREIDPSKRKELVWNMQEIVHRDVVYIIPFYSQAVQAYRIDRFTGWITDSDKLALEDVSSLLVIEPVK